jgi:hypothetical protein
MMPFPFHMTLASKQKQLSETTQKFQDEKLTFKLKIFFSNFDLKNLKLAHAETLGMLIIS